jgi:hypothetical protein
MAVRESAAKLLNRLGAFVGDIAVARAPGFVHGWFTGAERRTKMSHGQGDCSTTTCVTGFEAGTWNGVPATIS